MLKPTGSFDFNKLTYSLALESPASKWVIPFCSGTCFAEFSRWKLKKTNLPKNKDKPVLKLITKDGLNSDLITPTLDAGFLDLMEILALEILVENESVGLNGLRPWNDWGVFWMVAGVENKAEAIVFWLVLFLLSSCWYFKLGFLRKWMENKCIDLVGSGDRREHTKMMLWGRECRLKDFDWFSVDGVWITDFGICSRGNCFQNQKNILG